MSKLGEARGYGIQRFSAYSGESLAEAIGGTRKRASRDNRPEIERVCANPSCGATFVTRDVRKLTCDWECNTRRQQFLQREKTERARLERAMRRNGEKAKQEEG